MKVILKETVERVGKMGDIVEVADGYARNYLLPKGLGLLTLPRNVKALEHTKKVIADKIKKERVAAEEIAKKMTALTITLPVQVNEEGHLFGSVSARDITNAIIAQGIEMDRHHVLLDQPIKELGSSFVTVKMPHDVTTQVKVEVVKAEE